MSEMTVKTRETKAEKIGSFIKKHKETLCGIGLFACGYFMSTAIHWHNINRMFSNDLSNDPAVNALMIDSLKEMVDDMEKRQN